MYESELMIHIFLYSLFCILPPAIPPGTLLPPTPNTPTTPHLPHQPAPSSLNSRIPQFI